MYGWLYEVQRSDWEVNVLGLGESEARLKGSPEVC